MLKKSLTTTAFILAAKSASAGDDLELALQFSESAILAYETCQAQASPESAEVFRNAGISSENGMRNAWSSFSGRVLGAARVELTKAKCDAHIAALQIVEIEDRIRLENVEPQPLTEEQLSSLVQEILTCWNIGSLSREALKTTVVVAFRLDFDGRPILKSIRLVSEPDGRNEWQTFESARRAIIRCGASGLAPPNKKYTGVQLEFDPSKPRIQAKTGE